MRVENMTNDKGNHVENQFVISEANHESSTVVFQSYQSVIVKIVSYADGRRETFLDASKWDYSKTTGKYRNLFLCETKKETERKIKEGTYKLANLNV
jgi:hypothetical protein